MTDEKNISHPTVLCEVILLVGNNDSHFLSLIFLTDKRKKSDIYNLIVKYLDEYVIVDNLGKTNFGPTSKQLTYTDVAHQSQEFRDALSELTKYGILTPRNVFDGEHPLTWNEYIRLYVWAIYHKRLSDHSIPDDTSSPTFNDVIRTLPVDMNAYVNSSQRDMFELMLRMRLASVSLPVYSEATLDQFRLQKDSIYHAEWQKIDDFEYLYFRGMKMSPN